MEGSQSRTRENPGISRERMEEMSITDVTMWLRKEGFAEDVLSAFEGELVKPTPIYGGRGSFG